MNVDKVTAIILSAGYSSRMGEFKPLLRLGDMTLLEREVKLFQGAGIGDIRVVVGHRSEDVLQLLRQWNVSGIINEQYQNGMFSSVMAGVRSLAADREAFFVLPVDIPLVRLQTIKDLLQAYHEGRGDILYPQFFNDRGHPPLIKAELADEIKSWQGAEGLRGFLATHEYCSADVPVVDEYVLFDLDTEEDYQTLVARYKKYHLPTVKESLMLLEREVPAGKVASLLDHSWNVAKVAVSLARELNRCGCGLDTDLVMAAGLLHDLAKGQSNHATAGASLLRSMGYAAVADVVGTHMDITLRDEDPMSPQELVYLADKLLQGSRITGLEARFQAKMDRYGSDAQARRAITARFDNAFRIKRRIEGIMGRPIETMVTELAASKD